MDITVTLTDEQFAALAETSGRPNHALRRLGIRGNLQEVVPTPEALIKSIITSLADDNIRRSARRSIIANKVVQPK